MDELVTAMPTSYLVPMPVRKKTLCFDDDVWLAVKRHAEDSGTTPSGVVNRAVRSYGQLQAGIAAMEEWQRLHGALAADELAEADRVLEEALADARDPARRRHSGVG